jgi:hypothetical protein
MIGPLRLALLVALAVYILGRTRTRSPAGLLLVLGTSAAVVATEVSGLAWASLAESLIYGLAGFIVIFEPGWLVAHHGFAQEYQRVDRQVWQESLRVENDWRAGRIDDEEYSAAFDKINVRYRALRPPPGEWGEILDERIRIREGWSRIFADPHASSAAERKALGNAEKQLRKRISRAS